MRAKTSYSKMLDCLENAGTNVRMLERFYCSDLDPEAKIKILQSFRRGGPSP